MATSSGSRASGTSNASSASSTERSDVWKHFDKTGTKNVTCRLCAKQLAYHGGTTNLQDHLTRVHMDKYKPAKRTDDQPSLETFVRKCSDAKAKLINELIVDVVTMDIRPLALVDREGMRHLLLYLEPGYCLPSRKHVEYIRSLFGGSCQRFEVGKSPFVPPLPPMKADATYQECLLFCELHSR